MTRIALVAATAFVSMIGVAHAQTSTSSTTSTQTTTEIPVPAQGVVESTRERTVDSNGVVTDRTKTNATTVSPTGETTTTRRSTETTTVR